jgi:hypothetical protein
VAAGRKPASRSKASHLPFAAIAAGRARLGRFGMHALMGGLVIRLAASWLGSYPAHRLGGGHLALAVV